MVKLDPTTFVDWRIGKKTKPIKAKHIKTLLVDPSVVSKFLVETLEGREPLSSANMICIGPADDAWQQAPKKLLGKYNVTGVDGDGWMICEPKPDNEQTVKQVTADMLDSDGKFCVIGLWGEESDEGPKQYGVVGDYVVRSIENLSDVWIVHKMLYDNTYETYDRT